MNDDRDQRTGGEKKTESTYKNDAFSDVTATAVLDSLKQTLAKQTVRETVRSQTDTQTATRQSKPKQDTVLPESAHGAAWHEKPHLSAADATVKPQAEPNGDGGRDKEENAAPRFATTQPDAAAQSFDTNAELQAGRKIYRHGMGDVVVPDMAVSDETREKPADKKANKENKKGLFNRNKNTGSKAKINEPLESASPKQKFKISADKAQTSLPTQQAAPVSAVQNALPTQQAAPVSAVQDALPTQQATQAPAGQDAPPTQQAAPVSTIQNTPPTQQAAPVSAGQDAPPTQQAASVSAVQDAPQTQQAAPVSTIQNASPTQQAAPVSAIQNAPLTQQAAPVSAGQDAPSTQQAASVSTVQNTPPTQQAAPVSAGQDAPLTQQAASVSAVQDAPQTQQAAPVSAIQNAPLTQQAAAVSAGQNAPSNSQPASSAAALNVPRSPQAVSVSPVPKAQQGADNATAAGKRIFRADSGQAASSDPNRTTAAGVPASPTAYAAAGNQPQPHVKQTDALDVQVTIQDFHVAEPQDKQTKRFVKRIQLKQSRRSEKSLAYSFFVICIAVMLVLTGYSAIYQNKRDAEAADTSDQGSGVVAPIPEQETEPEQQRSSMREKDGVTYLEIEGHEMILVNKTYALPEAYNHGIDTEAQEAFEAMIFAAQTEGLTIYLVSGFRSYETQHNIYYRNVDYYGEEQASSFSAKPGHSEHQTGLAFDVAGTTDSDAILTGSFKNTPEFAWLTQHAAEYGFILRYPEGKINETGYIFEPWHYRYVGPELARILTESGQTVEAYAGLV